MNLIGLQSEGSVSVFIAENYDRKTPLISLKYCFNFTFTAKVHLGRKPKQLIASVFWKTVFTLFVSMNELHIVKVNRPFLNNIGIHLFIFYFTPSFTHSL